VQNLLFETPETAMARSIANIIAEHEAARARTASQEAKPPVPQWANCHSLVPLAGMTTLAEATSAQGPHNFDPVALAKLPAGEIARKFREACATRRYQNHQGMRSLTPVFFFGLD
jgi:hypothetical protein